MFRTASRFIITSPGSNTDCHEDPSLGSRIIARNYTLPGRDSVTVHCSLMICRGRMTSGMGELLSPPCVDLVGVFARSAQEFIPERIKRFDKQ